jgi:hypothetical protein
MGSFRQVRWKSGGQGLAEARAGKRKLGAGLDEKWAQASKFLFDDQVLFIFSSIRTRISFHDLPWLWFALQPHVDSLLSQLLPCQKRPDRVIVDRQCHIRVAKKTLKAEARERSA